MSLRNTAVTEITKAAPRPSRAEAWSRPGRFGKRSNNASTRNMPITASGGQHEGHTRSHNSAARARRSRIVKEALSVGERSVMLHLALTRDLREDHRASRECYPMTTVHHSLAAPE